MARNTNIYPSFQSTFKCLETYKGFIQGVKYEITGFGTDKREGKKVSVWYITALNFEEKEFSVIKTTVNRLIDKGIIKIIYDAEM